MVSRDRLGSRLGLGTRRPTRTATATAERRRDVDFHEFYAQRPRSAGEDDDGVLVLTTDGKGVAMRREDLRKQTRKAAEKHTPKLKKRSSKGEKTATRRMAQVAAVYMIDRFVREPDDIVGEFTDKEADAKPARPRPHDKRVWASLTHEAHEVIGEEFAEAERTTTGRFTVHANSSATTRPSTPTETSPRPQPRHANAARPSCTSFPDSQVWGRKKAAPKWQREHNGMLRLRRRSSGTQ